MPRLQPIKQLSKHKLIKQTKPNLVLEFSTSCWLLCRQSEAYALHLLPAGPGNCAGELYSAKQYKKVELWCFRPYHNEQYAHRRALPLIPHARVLIQSGTHGHNLFSHGLHDCFFPAAVTRVWTVTVIERVWYIKSINLS